MFLNIAKKDTPLVEVKCFSRGQEERRCGSGPGTTKHLICDSEKREGRQKAGTTDCGRLRDIDEKCKGDDRLRAEVAGKG